jgi:hypothetical protein
LPWDGTDRLALERPDRPGLASFLAKHRACGGGIDIKPLPGENGLMIRVTCTHCGQAIEAPAASWEGWWEEQVLEAPAPRRRFEPRRERLVSSAGNGAPPRVVPASEPRGVPGWRQVLLAMMIVAWTVAGLLLIASAISH